MNVSQILKEKGRAVITAQGGQSLQDAAQLLANRGIGAVVVVDQASRVVGVLSERDIVRAVAQGGPSAMARPIREFMTETVVTCAPADSLDTLMERMTDRRIRHLPVLEQERLAGIVSIGDVVKMRIAETELEAAALRDYVAGA